MAQGDGMPRQALIFLLSASGDGYKDWQMATLSKLVYGRGRSWSWPGLRNDRHSGNQCEGWLFCFGLGIGNRLDVIGPCLQRDPPPLDHLAGPIRPLRLVALAMGKA